MQDNSIQQLDFASLATIKPATIQKVTILRQTKDHIVCRLTCDRGSYILKWFNVPADATELHVYALLSKVGVDTLAVYEHTDRALLLEDIQCSPRWRLADPADMGQALTGRAVAEWYRSLHCAGREALGESNVHPTWLRSWVAEITEQSLIKAGAVFQLQAEPAWQTAIECIAALRAKYLALPQTFNYDDFAMENLALSREAGAALRAVVFDYDCFKTGVAYSDWRNVMYSLDSEAKSAFAEAYGPVSEKEHLLDEPLAVLSGLIEASRRSKIPKWALPLRAAVVNGELEESIRRAREDS